MNTPPRPRTHGQAASRFERDARVLAEHFAADFPEPPTVTPRAWLRSPAACVTDCVLSLRKNYTSTVTPRVRAFVDTHPGVETCADLLELIASRPSPEAFHRDALRMNSPGKAAALVAVAQHLDGEQARFDGESERDRLTAWAEWARPGDHLMLDIRGFGLAGFQYLRVLFGAQTIKPDVHILRYAERALGRPFTSASSAVRLVYIVERAGEMLSVPVRSLDAAMWQAGSGQSLTDV